MSITGTMPVSSPTNIKASPPKPAGQKSQSSQAVSSGSDVATISKEGMAREIMSRYAVVDDGIAYLKDPPAAPAAAKNDPLNTADAGGTGLPTALQHYMEDIANDPNIARQTAYVWGNYPIIVGMKLPIPPNGGPMSPEQFNNICGMLKGYADQVAAVQSQAKAVYQQGKAAGKSDAEICADLLKFQLSQPDSYWQARDPQGLAGDLKGTTKAELDALQQAIAAAKSRGSVLAL